MSINASHWPSKSLLHYMLYASNTKALFFIKKQIIQNKTPIQIASAFKTFYHPFACLIHDTNKNDYFLIRDHFGYEPFYYMITDTSQLCFGSTLPDVLTHCKYPKKNHELIEQTLIDVCASHMTYTNKTFYENIQRVTPGELLQLQLIPQYMQKHHVYWHLTPETPFIRYASDADYDAHFASLLKEACVNACEEAPESVALEFSGGLDTSALLTSLHTIKQPAQLFMHVGDVIEERQYGEQLLKKLSSNNSVHFIDADNFDAELVINQCKQWFAGGAPYLFFMFAANIHQAVLEKKCRILLSGFGGDECVSSHAPLRAYGAEVSLKQLWQELNISSQSHVRLLLQMILFKQPRLHYAQKHFRSYLSNLTRKQLPVHHKSYHSLQEREADWLTGSLSYHVRMRIEYSAVVARFMGFRYQYPLLYPPLLEYCFALPPTQKRRQGKNRLLMRRFLANHLSSDLFNTHKKCGDILPGTMPKFQNLYQTGQLNYLLTNLPYHDAYDEMIKQQLITHDRFFHVDLLRYMFR